MQRSQLPIIRGKQICILEAQNYLRRWLTQVSILVESVGGVTVEGAWLHGDAIDGTIHLIS